MDWFSADGLTLTTDHAGFLEALRESAASWRNDPACSVVFEADDTYPFLRVGFDLIDKDHPMTILCMGAYFRDGRAIFGEMNSQEFFLVDRVIIQREERMGTPVELGHAVAHWMEEVLRRPFVYREWSDLSTGRFREWRIADSQAGLVAAGRRRPPPSSKPTFEVAVNLR